MSQIKIPVPTQKKLKAYQKLSERKRAMDHEVSAAGAELSQALTDMIMETLNTCEDMAERFAIVEKFAAFLAASRAHRDAEPAPEPAPTPDPELERISEPELAFEPTPEPEPTPDADAFFLAGADLAEPEA